MQQLYKQRQDADVTAILYFSPFPFTHFLSIK